jgi:Spy/CpxP family protein refolding chaperone
MRRTLRNIIVFTALALALTASFAFARGYGGYGGYGACPGGGPGYGMSGYSGHMGYGPGYGYDQLTPEQREQMQRQWQGRGGYGPGHMYGYYGPQGVEPNTDSAR